VRWENILSIMLKYDGVCPTFRAFPAAAVSEVTGGWDSDPGGILPE